MKGSVMELSFPIYFAFSLFKKQTTSLYMYSHFFLCSCFFLNQKTTSPRGLTTPFTFFTAQFPSCNENVAESIFQYHFRPQNKFQKLKLELTRKYICCSFFLLSFKETLVAEYYRQNIISNLFQYHTLAQSQTKCLFLHKRQC